MKDAYSLAGRVLATSKDVSSYQFDIHSNISMLGESFTLVKGNGPVDYANGKMAVRLKSVEDTIDMIVVDDIAYSRTGDSSWETRKLNRKIWDTYDQLTQTNMLLANSTELSMEREGEYLILTAIPDSNVLLEEARRTGLQLRGDERLNEYTIRYTIGKDSYRISSIESHMEFMMNVQGLMSPVIINNRVDFYGYDEDVVIVAPFSENGE
ncbi:MAG: hypothetical protein SCH66_10765 [Methanolobus sp.]|nr:hypothetical protein [Methanolobus sp.]